jgi:hypothetical protein
MPLELDTTSLALSIAALSLAYVLSSLGNPGPDLPLSRLHSQCEVAPTRRRGETAVRTSKYTYTNYVTSVDASTKTLCATFRRGAKLRPQGKCLGTWDRDRGEVRWSSYAEVSRLVPPRFVGQFRSLTRGFHSGRRACEQGCRHLAISS